MASPDVIGGGNIEPRALEDEMRSAYLDYAMSVIVGRALPGRPRRPQARPPPRPVRDERERASARRARTSSAPASSAR